MGANRGEAVGQEGQLCIYKFSVRPRVTNAGWNHRDCSISEGLAL